MTDWTPATDAEAAMRDALADDDQALYFRILSGVELLLPVSPDASAGRAPMGWGTWTVGDRTHVLAFTSPEAMRACLAEHAGSARQMPYHELAAGWPNLEWWLAVNPGLPIEGYLPAWFVSQLARGDVRLPGRSGDEATGIQAAPRRTPPADVPGHGAETGHREDTGNGGETGRADAPARGRTPVQRRPAGEAPAADGPKFAPDNELEEQLAVAASGAGNDTLLSILLLAKVLLPVADGADARARPGDTRFQWRTEKSDGDPYVPVFTSARRLEEHVGQQVETLGVRFVQLIRTWPDPSWSLQVNPGSPISVTLRAAQIAALASSAAEVGLDDDAGEAGDSGVTPAGRVVAAAVTDQPPTMQKVLGSRQLAWYLERGYDRVSGFVHRAAEVAHLRTPADLVRGLGLRYDGAPSRDDLDEVYLLRWPAFIPSLYRIPYGGRNEAAMAAMEGWVIERAPFRGNGFAPSDNGDVIAEFKVDSVRLPHGAQLVRVRPDGSSQVMARLDADGPHWARVEEH